MGRLKRAGVALLLGASALSALPAQTAHAGTYRVRLCGASDFSALPWTRIIAAANLRAWADCNPAAPGGPRLSVMTDSGSVRYDGYAGWVLMAPAQTTITSFSASLRNQLDYYEGYPVFPELWNAN